MYKVEIDFDKAHRAWMKNKRRVHNKREDQKKGLASDVEYEYID
mgnify:FL=1|jgi:hypothetical protein